MCVCVCVCVDAGWKSKDGSVPKGDGSYKDLTVKMEVFLTSYAGKGMAVIRTYFDLLLFYFEGMLPSYYLSA